MFAKAVATVQSFVPQFKVIEKSKSSLHRLIAKILFFVPYMEQFWTTLGYTAAYPEGASTDWDTVYHEGRHSLQASQASRIVMGFLYLIPISLLPIVIGLAITCGVIFGWGILLYICLGLIVLTLSPIPAYWRMKYELDAYTVSITLNYWTTNITTQHRYLQAFTGFNYYLMWPFAGNMTQRLNKAMESVVSKSVLSDPYYRAIAMDLQQSGRLHPAHQGISPVQPTLSSV